MHPADQLPSTASAWHRRWRRLAAFGALRLAFFITLWVVLVGGFAWLGGSEAGLRWACARLAQASDGRLQLAGVDGRLLGDWHVQSLRWRDAVQTIAVDNLRVTWSPLSLTRGELVLTRVEAAGVRFVSTAPGDPARLPDDLGLPLAVRVEQLRVGRLWIGQSLTSLAPPPSSASASPVSPPGDGVPWFVAETLEARLASDAATHRIESLQMRVGRLDVAAQATLNAQAPFALSGHAQVHGTAHGQDFALALDAGGTLARVRVDGRASVAEAPGISDKAHAAGELRATLEPFAPASVALFDELRVRLVGVDPQLFAAGAPHARLDVDLALARAAEASATLNGRLRLHNRDAGSVDRERLPIQALDSAIAWQGDAVRLDGLLIALAGGGRLAGHGRVDVARERLEIDLAAQNVDAHALHALLPSTRLAGPAQAIVGVNEQHVDVDWRDARYAVKVRARADAQAIDVAQLQVGALAAGAGARVVAQGRLALSGQKRFAAQGRLRDVDVARLLGAVGVGSLAEVGARSVINADFEAHGALQPTLDVALHLALDGSRIGTQPLSGSGDVDWSAGRLRRAEVDLLAAGNRLRASGALGRPGDTLTVALAAPRLSALGWPKLAGDLRASLDVGGGSTTADPDFAVKVDATRLRVGDWLDSTNLSLDARLAPGAQGKLALDLRCSACSLPAYFSAPLTLSVAADGVRAQHRVRAQLVLPQRREVRLVADGELVGRLLGALGDARRSPGDGRGSGLATGQGAGNAPGWRGTLAELRFSGGGTQALAELAAPAPLSLAADLVSFGPASLAGRLGRVSLDRLSYAAGLWQSSGRLQQFRPHDVLAEFPSLQAWRETLGGANAQPLVLAGEWDVRGVRETKNTGSGLPAAPVGRAALWLERGDLALGTVALGLAEARLQASFGDGRLAASASLRGARAGVISGEISCAYPIAGSPVQIDRNSAWQGRVQADVPDLSWLGALLGEGWQVAGQARGEMRLAGSAAHPEITGQLRGERLAVRALDLGMRLERGEAALDVTPQRLRLARLRFESDLAPLPRALRLGDRADVARLTASPGVVEASGELSLVPLADAPAGSAGRLAVRFERYGIVQRADQWVAVSGEGELRLGERLLEIDGKLRADAAFWALAAIDRPALSDDVVLRKEAERPNNRVGRAFKVDLALALGNSAYFRGAGVDSRLAGALRIRSDDAGLPRATGSIRTVDGRFDAYGQKLDIERGIVNFQGPIDNPGLNLLAVRRNLPVEAGVEVSGTAQRPVIRLVSSPTVPDAEKLSWLVLGRSPEQQGGDGALLLAAAQTIVGGQDGGVLRQLQRALGIDEFGVSTGQVGGYSTLPTSRVASTSGFGASQSVNGQIVTVGKRLSSNALLSYQQSLNTTESIVKLTVNLSRQLSVVGSAGSDSALDVFWTHNFGK